MFLEVFYVGVATQKPQKLMDDAFEMEFFSSKERKTLREVKAHLMAKYRFGARSCAIAFRIAFIEDAL